MSYNIQEGVIELGDHTMDYGIFGKGSEPLLLIRGLNIRRLRGTVPTQVRRYRTYADNFRVYVIDRREPLPTARTVVDVRWEGGHHRVGWEGEVAADECTKVGTVRLPVPDVAGPLTFALRLDDAEGTLATNEYETTVRP